MQNAPASEGVKKPNRIPTIRITGKISAQIELRRFTRNSDRVMRGSSLLGMSNWLRLQVMVTVAIRKIIMRTPGMMPAANRRPIDTSPTKP